MKKHPCAHRGIAAVLAVALSTAGICGIPAFAGEEAVTVAPDAAGTTKAPTTPNATAPAATATYKKSEVVYANLGAGGNPEALYVINRFDVARAGAVVDRGEYASVQNLTNETELTRQGDVTTFAADEGVFFYQGNATQTALPWKVSLAYTLDGKTVPADQVAGASGALSIHVTTARNQAINQAFYDSFMMQMTFTLPGDAASDIRAGDAATLASAGKDTTVAYTVLPGRDGDFELKAQVKDFHMPGVQVVALPYTSVVAMPKTDGMVDGMQSLADAVSQLNDGTASLASGVGALSNGANNLSSGAAAFGRGLVQLDGSSGAVVGASSQIKEALATIALGFQDMDLSQLEKLKQLPGGLKEMADGLDQLAQGSRAAQQGYDQALGALDGAIAAIPAATLTEEQIAALIARQGSPEDAGMVGDLAKNYAAAQTVKGTYAATKPAFDGANDMLAASADALPQTVESLRGIADELDAALSDGQLDKLAQLADGMVQLSSQYNQFHDGLVQYTSGVSALAANYGELESGVAQLTQGTGQLSGGADALRGGMGQLNDSTITLPETTRTQIAEMTAEFDFPAFDPVSFMSPENKSVSAVQFVMTTATIEKPKPVQEEKAKPEQTLWDRFVALFAG